MVPRPSYIAALDRYRDRDLIKVVTGMRRVGKSVILQLYREHLLAGGVSPSSIVAVNFEVEDNASLRNPMALLEYAHAHKAPRGTTYVFLDEVQEVPEFQRVVDSLFAEGGYDLYVTGSNSHLLSGDLATLLTGRYVQVEVLPLSYAELRSAVGPDTGDQALMQRYLRFGGLPMIAALGEDEQTLLGYLDGVYSTVVRKDVLAQMGAGSPDLLDALSQFLMDSIGSPSSLRSIVSALKANGWHTSAEKVSEYMGALCDAYVFHKVRRYDLRGKALLAQQEKYYANDPGLRTLLLGLRGGDVGHLLENAVYLELRRRATEVRIGKIGASEVDFVARESGDTVYYQVSASVLDPNTLERELAPLRAIGDNYPKRLLTLDEIGNGSHEGIIQRNVIDWLLDGNTREGA